MSLKPAAGARGARRGVRDKVRGRPDSYNYRKSKVLRMGTGYDDEASECGEAVKTDRSAGEGNRRRCIAWLFVWLASVPGETANLWTRAARAS